MSMAERMAIVAQRSPGRRGNTAAQVSAQLRDAITRINRRMRQARPVGELTQNQISVLTSLDLAGALTPRELADAERVSPPTMTKVLAKLEARGLVQRSPHPTDVDAAHLDAWRAAGVNRLSIGVQSVVASELVVLGRDHRFGDGLAAVERAMAHGGFAVSADFILGTPTGDPASIPPALAVDHMSVYELTIEERTAFGQRVRDGRLVPRGEDTLTDYFFNRHMIAHRFCATCGCQPFGRGKGPEGNEMAAINLRCVPEVDIDALEIEKGPIATIQVPIRLRFGLHGNFAPSEAIGLERREPVAA